MKIIETTVYTFNELSDSAKEKAREWYREGMYDYGWWNYTYEDAERIGLKIESFNLYHHEIAGKLTDTVNGVCERIIKEHGEDCSTYTLAKTIDLRKDNDDDFTVCEFNRSLLKVYLRILREESEYMESNEAVDENILANEYTFTESGKRF